MTENGEKENEPQDHDLQRSPGSDSIRSVSTLQKLKCSLSFKSMMRSKSVENFFQRSGTDTPPHDNIIIIEAPPSIVESPFSDYLLTNDRSPSISPNLSLSSLSPSSSPSLSVNPTTSPAQSRPQKTHCFLEYVFRRPTVCQQCKQIITGNSKHCLRCKTCKLAAHLWCSSELSQQFCNGKSGAFKRNFSSPLLTNELFSIVKEAPTTQEKGKGSVDPVYETLRYGTSLAQMSRGIFNSITEPCSQSEEVQEKMDNESDAKEECGVPESEVMSLSESEKSKSEDKPSLQPPRHVELRAIHTYVVLYKFLPHEKNDLGLQPGDRVQVIDDSNEDWWKGKKQDKVGFFPANFVQRVRPGERVWKVIQGFHGSREKGQMTIKEFQICIGKGEETDGFLKLTSGKKRGLVPSACVMEI